MKFTSAPTGANPKKGRGSNLPFEKISGHQTSMFNFLKMPPVSPHATLESLEESMAAHSDDDNGCDSHGSALSDTGTGGVEDSQVASSFQASTIF
jgi:hypothetical protein